MIQCLTLLQYKHSMCNVHSPEKAPELLAAGAAAVTLVLLSALEEQRLALQHFSAWTLYKNSYPQK